MLQSSFFHSPPDEAGSAFPHGISEAERLAEGLAQSERRFDLLFETHPLPMWIYDLANHDFLSVNLAAAALFGYTQTELLDMRVHDLWPPEQRIELEREATQPRGEGYFRVGVRTRVGKGGRRLQVELHSHDLLFKGRRARLILARDLTHQLFSARMLAHGAQALEMLASRTPLAEVLDELCCAVEEESETGAACRCAVLLSMSGRFRVAAAPHLPAPLARAIESLSVGDDTPLLRDAAVSPSVDSDPRWGPVGAAAAGLSSCWSVPILSRERSAVGILAVFCGRPHEPTQMELTFVKRIAQIAGIALDHERADAELRRLNAELEGRVARRTAELEAANHELDDFSAAVSHDLRAPLRAILGFSGQLLEDHGSSLNEEGENLLRRISATGQRMAGMIESLLSMARMSRSEIRQSRVDLSAIAAQIGEELRSAEPERCVDFHVEMGIIVEGDRDLLNAVLQNLIGNAWKFTRHALRPRVEFGRLRDATGTVCFVRDNGAGFDMRYADKLFTPFERLHAVTDYEGSGIGLATVRRAIHRLGGKVWGEGEPGRGATFYFTL